MSVLFASGYPTEERNEKYYPAKMTENQFIALQSKLEYDNIIEDLRNIQFVNNIQKSKNYDFNEIKKYLYNGWSTEYILNLNLDVIEKEYLPFTLHWSFPQAYYSVYTVVLAFFKAIGNTQSSHTSVLKKLGKMIEENKYPKSISFYSIGGKKNISFENIKKNCNESSIALDVENINSIDKHICQFLKTTREIDLDDKKTELKEVKTKTGKIKRNFTEEEWEIVSDKIGCTTIFNLLYRKRIKSNYRDIEVFFNDSIDAESFLNSIIHIVGIINLIHEYYILRAIGKKDYEKLLNNLKIDKFKYNKDRYEILKHI